MSNAVPARRLNVAGLAKFADYVSQTRRVDEPPLELLFDDQYSEPLPIALTVEPLATDSKFDLGSAILADLQNDGDLPKLLEDEAVWPWLSLYHSSRTMPMRDGARFIGKPHRHLIVNSGKWASYDHGHRHLVRSAVQSVHYFGEFARVLLGDVGSASKAEENILSRKTGYPLAYMKNAVEAFYELHYDDKLCRAGKGANSTGPGGVIDFVRSLSQLDVNFDIYSLNANRLLELLPPSFDKLKSMAA